jgi:hypothetical protein
MKCDDACSCDSGSKKNKATKKSSSKKNKVSSKKGQSSCPKSEFPECGPCNFEGKVRQRALGGSDYCAFNAFESILPGHR